MFPTITLEKKIGYGQNARQTEGEGKARVDRHTCAGDKVPNMAVCKCLNVEVTTKVKVRSLTESAER